MHHSISSVNVINFKIIFEGTKSSEKLIGNLKHFLSEFFNLGSGDSCGTNAYLP